MGIRDEQREKRYWKILSAALDLFIQKGYHATRISDITKAVGMSTGLLFHYFKSKETLYNELISIGMSGPNSHLPSDADDPLTYLSNTAQFIFDSLKEHDFTGKMYIFMGQAYYSGTGPMAEQLKLMEMEIYTTTVKLFERGQATGVIRDGDPYAMAIAYWSAIQGICEQMAVMPESPCPKGEWLADMFRKWSD